MVANGVVFVNTQNQVYALSASGGTILWSSAPGPGSGAGLKAVAVANGIVYFVSAKDRLYAYSVHGEPVSARLPGGELGVKPSPSALKPDYSLKPSR